jgi:hypothetical protein
MRKIIFLSFLLMSLGACKSKCERLYNAMQKNPQCMRVDTKDTSVSIFTDSVSATDSKELKVDTNFVDSILYDYRDTCIHVDTVRRIIIANAKRVVASDSLSDVNDTFSIKIWYKDGELGYSLDIFSLEYTKDIELPQPVLEEPKPKKGIFKRFLDNFLVYILAILLVILVIREIKK